MYYDVSRAGNALRLQLKESA